jgi:hypothetical protein
MNKIKSMSGKLFFLAISLTMIIFLNASLIKEAHASPLMQYDQFDISYGHVFYDDSVIDDSNGVDLALSFSPIDNFFLEAGYGYANTEIFDVDVDSHILNYGVGVYYELIDDLLGDLAFGGANAWVDREGASQKDESGWYSAASLRYLLMKELEGNLGVQYSNFTGEDDGTWVYSAGLLYALSDYAALNTRVAINDDSDVKLNLGLRFAF